MLALTPTSPSGLARSRLPQDAVFLIQWPQGMDEAVEQPAFEILLARSAAFEEALANCFPEAAVVLAVPDLKHELVAAACILSIEHASVLRAAFAAAAPSSGAAVLRLQYEALLRSAWLLFVASPIQIDKLAKGLDQEAEQAAKNLPGYMVMLGDVVKKAPHGLSAPIAEFNQYSRHAFNSFVHSGIHPLRRTREGFPLGLATNVVRLSNGLMQFAYRLLASLSGSQQRMDEVTQLYKEFTDCLPMAEEFPNRDSTTYYR